MSTSLIKLNMIMWLVIMIPTMALAQDTITTFQSIPFVDGDVLNTETYIAMLYRLAIAIAAFLVIFKIILAGARLTVSDSVSGRSKAKDDITGALIGMLIILGAVTILNTINPNLTNISFLTNAEPTVINNSSFPTSSQVMDAEKKKVVDQGMSLNSVYKGNFGTPEHQAFIAKCREIEGTPIGYAAEKKVECYK